MALPRVGVTAQITGMVAVKPTDVWVAMRTGRGWSAPRPGPDETWVTPPEHDVMLHWDGGRWRRVPLPHLHDPITNLTAEAPDDVWGVAESDGLVRWNGKRWTTHTIAGWRHGPEIGRVAALARDDAWLSAAAFTNRGSHALVEHWDGRRWARVPAPTMPGGRTKLSAIAAASSDDAWAFGAYATGDPLRVRRTSGIVTEHWNGHGWVIVPEPVYHHTRRWFEIHDAVMVSHTEGWAVGRQARPFKPLVLHGNGTRWTAVPTRGCCELLAMAARDAEEVWAVGYTSDDNRYQPLVDRWNGRGWQTVPAPTGGGSTVLTAISTLTRGETIVAGTTTNASGTNYPVLLRFVA